MSTTSPCNAAGEAMQGDDFPRRTIANIGDLGRLLADYSRQCDREMADVSLSAFWPAISALVMASMDHDSGRREAMRTSFFNALAERIKGTRASHAQCDAWEQREAKRQQIAVKRGVSLVKENAALKARIAELEA